MLTWAKDKIGRGQVLRDQTEHVILLTRGKPVIDVYGENPPTTLLRAAARQFAQARRVLSPGRAGDAGAALCRDLLDRRRGPAVGLPRRPGRQACGRAADVALSTEDALAGIDEIAADMKSTILKARSH
jgi:hypothetical protein